MEATCPKCKATHSRGFVDGVDTYRCLRCGNTWKAEEGISKEFFRPLVPPRIPSRDDVMRGPGSKNPTVHGCIRLYQRGLFTWEQAMMIAVVELARHNDQIMDAVNRHTMVSSRPIKVQVKPHDENAE